jgi:hypothetical protein
LENPNGLDSGVPRVGITRREAPLSPFVMVAAEGRGMGGEDNGQNLEALAQRIEALAQRLAVLERESRELREVVGSGASDRHLETRIDEDGRRSTARPEG